MWVYCVLNQLRYVSSCQSKIVITQLLWNHIVSKVYSWSDINIIIESLLDFINGGTRKEAS